MHNTKLLILILGLFYFSITYSQSEISGRVFSADNKEFIFGANVYIIELKRGTATDINGEFKFDQVQAGNYTITISYIGYSTKKEKIQITDLKNIETDIYLDKLNYQLNEIVIAATKEEIVALDQPIKIHLIDCEKIEQTPGNNIDKVLDYIGGVNVERDFGIYSDKTTVSLRGVGSEQSRTLIVMNGIPLNKSEGGSVNWNLISKNSVNDIRVTKGPGNAKFGSNAMGGVIEISTDVPDKKLQGSVVTKFGSFNTYGYDINLGGSVKTGQTNKLYWGINQHLLKSDGYINIPEELITAADTDIVASYLNEYDMGGRIGYKSEKTDAVVSFNYYDDKRGKGFQVYEKDGGYSKHDTYNSSININHIFKFCRLYAFAYLSHENYFRVNEFMQDGEYKLYEVDSKRDDNGGKLFIEKRIGANHSFTTGMEFKDGNVNGSDIYYTSTDVINNRGKINILSAFIMDEFYLFNENLIFNMGFRYDYAKFYNGLFTIEDPSYSIEYLVDYQQNNIPSNDWSSISPKFSFQYKFSEKNRLYFSSGKGFSAPGLDNMCRSSKTAYGFTRLNPELTPEYLYNIETGADFQIVKNLNISQSVYHSIGRDFLYTVSTNDSVNMGYTVSPVFQTENISKVEMYGTETSLNFKLKSYLETFVNYAFMHSQIKDFKPKSAADFDLTDKFLNSIPFHKITAGISGKYKSLSANLLWKYIGERYINDRNVVDQEYFMTDKFPAYNQFDIRISGQYKERVTLALNIENVFDKIYNNYKGYLCPGRFIMIELLFNIN